MPLRIISIPGRSHENCYFRNLLAALEQHDTVIVPTTVRNCLSFRFDVLHINFPTHYITEYGAMRAALSALALVAYLSALRLAGCKIVYTVHDVVPLKLRHDRLLRSVMQFVLKITNGFIFLNRSSRAAFEQKHPQHAHKPWALVPHGPYSATLLPQADRLAAKYDLTGNHPAFVIGFLGAIKPYKSVDALLQLPRETNDGRPVHVVIAGKAERGYEASVDVVVAGLPGRVTRIDRRLTDTELDHWIQTVDLVLLPYTRGSNSGSAILALSNRARFATSDLVAFREIADEVGRPWIYCLEPGCSHRQTYAQLINLAAGELPNEADQRALSTYLDRISWPSAAHATAEFYRAISPARSLYWRSTLIPR